MTAFCTNLTGAALAITIALPAAHAQDGGAPKLDQLVRRLATSARVLVIGAHPDDEDTKTIARLARGRQVETAYLSLTRGDGGQNFIGNELGEPLGAIRTEELLPRGALTVAVSISHAHLTLGFPRTPRKRPSTGPGTRCSATSSP